MAICKGGRGGLGGGLLHAGWETARNEGQAGSCCVDLHLGLGLKCRRGRTVVATSFELPYLRVHSMNS